MSAAEGAPVAHITGAAATPPAVASRQAPTDLTLSFVDEATVRAVSAAGGEPEWLLAERLEGLKAFEALPIETNPLYTTDACLGGDRHGPEAAPRRSGGLRRSQRRPGDGARALAGGSGRRCRARDAGRAGRA
jgi:hypothetical protein